MYLGTIYPVICILIECSFRASGEASREFFKCTHALLAMHWGRGREGGPTMLSVSYIYCNTARVTALLAGLQLADAVDGS